MRSGDSSAVSINIDSRMCCIKTLITQIYTICPVNSLLGDPPLQPVQEGSRPLSHYLTARDLKEVPLYPQGAQGGTEGQLGGQKLNGVVGQVQGGQVRQLLKRGRVYDDYVVVVGNYSSQGRHLVQHLGRFG